MAIINSYPLGNINRKSKLLGTESPGQANQQLHYE